MGITSGYWIGSTTAGNRSGSIRWRSNPGEPSVSPSPPTTPDVGCSRRWQRTGRHRAWYGGTVSSEEPRMSKTVPAIREVGARALLGPDIALMLDFNQSLDPAEASRRIARLAPYDLHWIEEPVPQENLHGHATVRATSPIPIQAGENWWFPRGFAEAIAVGASDFIM